MRRFRRAHLLTGLVAALLVAGVLVSAYAGARGAGMGPEDQPSPPSISADGRYAAFASEARRLVPGDTNRCWDVFVYDRRTRGMERVSVSSKGEQANGDSWRPSIGGGGRYVAFSSYTSNLVPGKWGILVHDRRTRTTEHVSVMPERGHRYYEMPAVSADGRCVAFLSEITDRGPRGSGSRWGVFVRDRRMRTAERIDRPRGRGVGSFLLRLLLYYRDSAGQWVPTGWGARLALAALLVMLAWIAWDGIRQVRRGEKSGWRLVWWAAFGFVTLFIPAQAYPLQSPRSIPIFVVNLVAGIAWVVYGLWKVFPYRRPPGQPVLDQLAKRLRVWATRGPLDWLHMSRLQRAALKGKARLIGRLLAAGVKPNERDRRGWTALHRAAAAGEAEAVRALLAGGAQVNAADREGSTPLHWAARAGWPEAAEALLAGGAEVNAGDAWHATPLHYAALGGYQSVAEVLVAHGADVNARAGDSVTPLHAAAKLFAPPPGLVELLLAHGADVSARTGDGATPLHLAAAEADDTKCLELLLRHGADPNAKDAKGRTPVDWLEGQFTAARRLLEEYAESRSTNGDAGR